MKRLVPYLVILIVASGAYVTLINIYFYNWIGYTPTSPDRNGGQIYPYNNHGVTHYISWLDHVLDKSVMLIGAIGGAALFVVAIWARLPRRSQR